MNIVARAYARVPMMVHFAMLAEIYDKQTILCLLAVEWELIFPINQASKFTVHSNLSPNIGVLRIFPNITTEMVSRSCQCELLLNIWARLFESGLNLTNGYVKL